MKVEKLNLNIQKSGDFEEQTFRIAPNAKAFDILSSKLYSDVHLAIVRELSTNAWDSHQDAGNINQPFEVHLPNKMEPFFFIRDFGVGLSHQDVMHLYTTYFESTKTTTNNQIGCLGLGSKSPFAYTDNFSVTSWFQGKKRVYSMFKGQEGFPVVALMQTIDSDESNGIEVRFACKIEDVDLFRKKAQVVYHKFPIKPIFRGNSKFTIETKPVEIKGLDWRIYKHTPQRFANSAKTSYAIMGCIGYPIQREHLDGISSSFLRSIEVDIDFPIGSLEISASREELQYSELTKKSLKTKLQQVSGKLAEKISEKFVDCKTLWDAKCLYHDLFSGWDKPFNHLVSSLGGKVRWRGQLLGSINGIAVGAWASCICYSIREQANGIIVKRDKDIYRVQVMRDTAFVINDEDKQPGAKIKSWLKFGSDKIERVYLIDLIKWDKEHEDGLHKALGTNASLFRTLSSLPKPVRKIPIKKGTGIGGPYTKIPVYSKGVIFNESKAYYTWHNQQPDAWLPKDLDLSITDGVYVNWKNGAGEVGNSFVGPRKIKSILTALEAIDKKPTKLYGVKSGYLEKFKEKVTGWRTLEEYAITSLGEFIKNKNIAEQIKLHKDARRITEFDTLQRVASKIKKPSELKRFVNSYLSATDAQDDIKKAILLALEMNYELGTGTLKDQAKEIWKRYPMLKWIDKRYYDKSDDLRYEDAANYVELVDRKRGKKC